MTRPRPASRPSAGRSTRPTSAARCPTSTRRSRSGTSRTAGTTGSSGATSRSSPRSWPRFRAAGGARLVDLTLPASGATRPGSSGLSRGDRPPHRHGRRLVSRRLLPGRGADRSPIGRRRSPTRSSATRPTASPGPAIRAGIIGEIGTDKPWLSAQEERVHRAAARAARRTGLAITTHAVQSTVGLDQLDGLRGGGRRPVAGRHRPRRLPSRPRPTTWRSSSAARPSSSTSSA